MRVMELRGLPVIDPRTATRVGVVSDVIIDQEAGSIVAIEIQSAKSEAPGRIAAERVRRVGRSAVMLKPITGPELAPTAPDPDACLDLGAIAGMEVLGDDGNAMGRLADAHFDPDRLTIEAWELAVPKMERWLGGGGKISPSSVVSCSREMMLVRTSKHAAASAWQDERAATTQAESDAPARPIRDAA